MDVRFSSPPLITLGLLLFSYLIGSVPFGLVIVKLTTGKDIRTVESGRTGGTNAMRAAGFWAGLATTLLDILKGAVASWTARCLLPDYPWMHILAPLLAVLGHNYSIFLIERTPAGRLRLRGGAGGAPAAGGALGLWAPSILILIPIGAMILFFLGYASVATLSVGLLAIVMFAIRAALGLAPWQYILYGFIAEALLAISLHPNILRLLNGTERVVGWRARRMQKKQ